MDPRDPGQVGRGVATPEGLEEGIEEGGVLMKQEYSADFESFWEIYPKRFGSSKKLAFRNWNSRLREKVAVELLMDCARGYLAHCRQKGKLGTEFVMYPETFLGPNERFIGYKPKPPAISPELPGNSRKAPEALEDRIDGRAFMREIISKLAGAKSIA